MHWLTAVQHLREERETGVLVTVADVRGHAPRDAGAKMVVSADRTWGSVGGGNLEETAVGRARAMLESYADAPAQLTVGLSDKARTEHGRQCCGGDVTLLLEPLPVVADAAARVRVHHAPVPELALGSVPQGTHVLVMTHDHAEDFALCDAALRCTHLGSVGLIGSAAKWTRFQTQLADAGHGPETIGRITCPIGQPGITGKDPAVIAVAVAAALLAALGNRAVVEVAAQ